MTKRLLWQIRTEDPKNPERDAISTRLQEPCNCLVADCLLTGREAVYRLLAGCHDGRTCLLVTKPGESVASLLARITEAEQQFSPEDLLLISDGGGVLDSVGSDGQAWMLTTTRRKRIWFCRKCSPGTRYLTAFLSYGRLLRAAIRTDKQAVFPQNLESEHIRPGARLWLQMRRIVRIILRNGRQLKTDLDVEVFAGLLRREQPAN